MVGRSPLGAVRTTWLGWMIGLAVAVGGVAWLTYATPDPAEAPMANESSGSSSVVVSVNRPAVTVAGSPVSPGISWLSDSLENATGQPSGSVSDTEPTTPPEVTASPWPHALPGAELVASPTAAAVSSPTGLPVPRSTTSSAISVLSLPAPERIMMPGPSLTPTAAAPIRLPVLSSPPTVSPTVSATVPSPLMDVASCPSPSGPPHLWLARPIPPEANDWVSTYYPYGSTAGGEYLIHHGVEMVNPAGTPVLAAGAGTVLYAGDDRQTALGPRLEFYGQLVILEMKREYRGQPVFTLYGHLSTISVHVGQRVEVGQKVGEAGATGIAMGPHLHFEVRVADAYDYDATRNPELWLSPHHGRGLIVGQVLDRRGKTLPEVRITLYPADDLARLQREGWTYTSQGVSCDEELSENLVWGDVPAGEWAVVAHLPDVRLRQWISVLPGKIGWVCLRLPAVR
jgi:murein DD-endopeptidase MepM/ murein hydrolase activator NlpD